MSARDDERMAARREAFLLDRAVFRELRVGARVRVLWVSSSWEPYEYPVIRELVMRVAGEAVQRGSSWELEVEPTSSVPDRYQRFATIVLRDEEDAPRRADGTVDHQRCGSPNVVLMIWREGGRADGAHTSGGWVHLRAEAEAAADQLPLWGTMRAALGCESHEQDC